MSSRSVNEWVKDGDLDTVIRSQKSAIWVSSICNVYTFNAIRLSRCAEWLFSRPIRPEMRGSVTGRQFNSPQKRQSRREFSLGGVYVANDEDARMARAGRRDVAASTGRGCYHQLQGIELQCEWVKHTHTVVCDTHCKAACSGRSGSVWRLDRKKCIVAQTATCRSWWIFITAADIYAPFEGQDD